MAELLEKVDYKLLSIMLQLMMCTSLSEWQVQPCDPVDQTDLLAICYFAAVLNLSESYWSLITQIHGHIVPHGIGKSYWQISDDGIHLNLQTIKIQYYMFSYCS